MQGMGVLCARAYRDEDNLTHTVSIDRALPQAPCSAVLQQLQISWLLECPAKCSGHLEWLPPC